MDGRGAETRHIFSCFELVRFSILILEVPWVASNEAWMNMVKEAWTEGKKQTQNMIPQQVRPFQVPVFSIIAAQPLLLPSVHISQLPRKRVGEI